MFIMWTEGINIGIGEKKLVLIILFPLMKNLNQAHCSALLIVSAHRIILPSSNNFNMF